MKTKARRVMIVADISQSASGCWQSIRDWVSAFLDGLDEQLTPEIALLGTDVFFTPDRWKSNPTLPVQLGHAASLIAPVMTAARDRLDEIAAVIIVGSGEVFDLADWARKPEAWFLVQAGERPLAQEAEGWSHWPVGQAERLRDCLANLRPGAIAWPSHLLSGPVAQEWALDRAGFPMVLVPPIHGYVHLFPVLRAQFETYLARVRPAGWKDDGYAQYLDTAGPRSAARLTTPENYEAAFFGGALPEDISAFQAWSGPAYRALTEPEWLAAWQWLAAQPVCVLRADLDDDLHPSARDLWRFALEERAAQTLLELSFMRHGMVEWVKSKSGEWTGMGKPRHIHPFHDPLHDPPLKPTSLARRGKWFGFRLFRKAV